MAQTVYDRIQTMSKDELQQLIYSIYAWGHLNEKVGGDDQHFYRTLLDQPAFYAHTIVSSLSQIELVEIQAIHLDGSEPYYPGVKFLSKDSAYCYLKQQLPHIVTVDNSTFATPTIVYKIIPYENKFI